MDPIAFLNSPGGVTVIMAAALVILRTVLGIGRAVADGTFVLSKVGAALSSQLLGRVFPFATVMYFSFSVGLESPIGIALGTTAAGAASLFVAEQVGAIQEVFSSDARAARALKEEKGLELGNPVPQE